MSLWMDVLDRLLSGTPIGRIAGGDAMQFGGWQRLNAEYARQFGVELPSWPLRRPKKSLNRGGSWEDTTIRSILRWVHIVF